jgi:hypothetical protein
MRLSAQVSGLEKRVHAGRWHAGRSLRLRGQWDRPSCIYRRKSEELSKKPIEKKGPQAESHTAQGATASKSLCQENIRRRGIRRNIVPIL